MLGFRDIVIATALATLLAACAGEPNEDSTPEPPGNMPPGNMMPPDAAIEPPPDPMCAVGEICACDGDEDCVDGFCECADAACEQRVCRAAPCACSFGEACATPLDDGVADPNLCQGDAACYGGVCVTPVAEPGPPSPGEIIDTLSVQVRTKPGDFPATNDEVSVCLSQSHCYALGLDGVAFLQSDSFDVFHVENIALPRAQMDRVELRIRDSNGNGEINDWEPACVALQLDGEPHVCVDPVPVVLGDESASTTRWRIPEELRATCTSCYADVLTHGPMIGAVTPESARIWVRTDATRKVALRLSGGPGLDTAPAVAWAYPSATNDFTAVLEVRHLAPSSTYYYGIEIDGVLRSDPAWVFTTPPPRHLPGAFTFAFGSCARANHPQDIYVPIAEAGPDLFLFIGDNHYGDATTLDAHRWNIQAMRETPRRLLMAQVPTLATWDDHDFLGNNTDGSDPRRDTARRAFTEYWANPAFGADGQGIYFQHGYGDVDFFMLDGRYFRDPSDGSVVFGDPTGRSSLLGVAQTNWLLEALRASPATFKFLVIGSQWTDNGRTDSWASHLDARNAIFDAIATERVEGVVLLSGDRHRSEFRLLPRPGAYDLPELTSSPLANTVRACELDEEDVMACHDQGYQVTFVDVDTDAADPRIEATIFELDDGALVPAQSWIIHRSELDFE